VIFTQSSMIEITFLSKDTIGIIATSVYQVDHARCITIYFFVLWVNLLVLCFQGRVTYVLFRRCHTFIRHRPFYWKGWGLRFFKENYPKLFEFFFFISKLFLRAFLFPSLPERTKNTPFKCKNKYYDPIVACKIWMLLSYTKHGHLVATQTPFDTSFQ
jgi:hypothetical protein